MVTIALLAGGAGARANKGVRETPFSSERQENDRHQMGWTSVVPVRFGIQRANENPHRERVFVRLSVHCPSFRRKSEEGRGSPRDLFPSLRVVANAGRGLRLENTADSKPPLP